MKRRPALLSLLCAGCATTPMHIENQLRVERPVDEVFAFVANFENVPRWNYYVLEVRKTTQGPIAPGTVFHQQRRSDAQEYRVTQWEPGVAVTVETLPPERAMRRTLTFKSEGTGTLLVDAWDMDYPLVVRWAVAPRVRAGVAENLGKLKELLETGRTTLQDGRVSTLP
jgi:hypothetical protein